jgi:hypothetical protein
MYDVTMTTATMRDNTRYKNASNILSSSLHSEALIGFM